MTTASGLEEEDDQQPFSGSPGGFSSPQGSANDEEEEDIGDNYHTMKSGEQLYQVYSRVVRDQFIVDYVRVIHSPVSNCVHSLTPLNYVLYRKTIVRGNLMRK